MDQHRQDKKSKGIAANTKVGGEHDVLNPLDLNTKKILPFTGDPRWASEGLPDFAWNQNPSKL